MKMKMGLCEGRHPIPGVAEYVFGNTLNPIDIAELDRQAADRLDGITALDLYVTGLTVALISVINYCCRYGIYLTLWHYDFASNSYYPQPVLTREDVEYVREGGYSGYSRRC